MNSLFGGMGFRGPTGEKSGRDISRGDVLPKGYKAGQFQQFTPEQLQLFQSLFAHVSPESQLAGLAGGDQGAFQELEAPQLRQFNELLGGLGSRFSGMGLGARRSSGFQNQATAASSNFAQQLAAQRQLLQRQALQDLMSTSQTLLSQRPYQRFLEKEPPSFWEQLLGGVAPIAGAIGGGMLGGMPGAQLGASLGTGFGQAFR